MIINAPIQNEFFFSWFKSESEKRWENIQLKSNIYGFQIQAGSKWKPGLSSKEISDFENELGFQFPEILKLFYQNMNGLDKPGINVYGESGEPYAYRPVFYSFPDDLVMIQDYINWVYEDFKINEEDVVRKGISHIFPIYSHRFILTDLKENYILSMYGKDVVLYSPTLKHLLCTEILGYEYNDGNEYDENDIYKKVDFWFS